MHVMAVGGCANIEIEQLFLQLSKVGVELAQIRSCIEKFRLPSARGGINKDWFSTKRFSTTGERDGCKGFSSEVLIVVPLFLYFLQHVIAPLNLIDPDYIECFRQLDRLLKLFQLGHREAARHAAEIEATIDRHATLFVRMYPDMVKPKFHALFHVVPTQLSSIGKLMNCWVTERRHRAVKTPSAYCFNHFEDTITKAQLLTLFRWTATCIFQPIYLVNPIEVQRTLLEPWLGIVEGLEAGQCKTSAQARLICGDCSKGDVVMDHNRNVCQIERFFAVSSMFWAVAKKAIRIDATKCVFTEELTIVDCSTVTANLTWALDGDSFQILLPPVSAIW